MMKRFVAMFIILNVLLCSIASVVVAEPRAEANICNRCGTHMSVKISPWQHESTLRKTCSKHGEYLSYTYYREYRYTCGNCGYYFEDYEFDTSGCPDC